MFKHIKTNIQCISDMANVIHLYKKHKPEVVAFDTETTGLNIGHDIPFLFQFGWVHEDTTYTYAVYDLYANSKLYLTIIKYFYKLCLWNNALVIGHNIKFDLHMLRNCKLESPLKNLSDTMICIRLAHDSLTVENGGPPLGLKDYTAKFIDKRAKDHERLLKAEQGSIAKGYNLDLINRIKKLPNNPTPPGTNKSWNKGAMEILFKEVTATYEDLPTKEMRDTYLDWYNCLPKVVRDKMTEAFVTRDDIPYTLLNVDNLIAYGHLDIVYTLAVYYKTMPVIKARKQLDALQRERDCILPLYKMESVGFYIDKDYVLESKKKMYDYIIKRNEDLCNLLGQKIGIGQHQTIIKIIKEKYNITLEATNDTYLGTKMPQLINEGYTEVVDILNTIKELRTLNKWYSTYLLRFVNEMRNHDRTYTQIYQVGTVSGRVTSDFQQFPKYGIKDIDGNDLFNPRRMVIKSPEYAGLIYLDYSQIELRFQAMYTILVGYPDKNLCRAYMPYECYFIDERDRTSNPLWRHQDHVWEFDYTNPKCIELAYELDWLHKEDHKPWHKVDVHSATTALAFPELSTDSDEFKKMRGKVGKRVNFAKNYGARYAKISTMFPEFKFSEEKLHEIDDAYYAAFPGVKAYHQYCYDLASSRVYATNLFNVRYYGLTGHKLINTLVQGSSAYFLKEKIVEVSKYLEDNKCKTRFQMNIHDEMSFELAKGEEHIIKDLQRIMQTFEDSLVPIVADLEISTTSWADKKEVEELDNVNTILYGTL